MTHFFPIKTDDGTISLYNTEVKDIYHSKVGACTEALNKFVIPSGMLEYARIHNEVNILDTCFGLGYNSKVAVQEINKINPDCRINITGLEIDPYVLAFSALIKPVGIDTDVNEVFNTAISSIIDLDYFISEYGIDVKFSELDNDELNFDPSKLSSGAHKSGLLHNIYYRSNSNRYSNTKKACYNRDKLNIEIYIDDARKAILELNPHYNFILHDPFSPYKVPTLWSVELFKEYLRLLDITGNITTYSSAAAIRSGLIEAGFFVGRTDPIGRKSAGTIAFKSCNYLLNPLSDIELGLLTTNSGIPYYDKFLNYTSEEIITNRKELQKISGRITTSKYLKENNY